MGCQLLDVPVLSLNIANISELTVDVTEGRGASFSLEIPLGFRFLI